MAKPDVRLDEIKKLMAIFRPERIVYITVTMVAVIVLIGCAIYLIARQQYPMGIALFAPTGGIMYSSGRLLKMWNDVVRILYGKEVAPTDG
jgi:hypothetical protein